MRNNSNTEQPTVPGSRPQTPDPGIVRDGKSDTPPPVPMESNENPPPPITKLWAVALLYNRTEPQSETTLLMGFSFKDDQIDAIQEVKGKVAHQIVGWNLIMWNAGVVPVTFK